MPRNKGQSVRSCSTRCAGCTFIIIGSYGNCRPHRHGGSGHRRGRDTSHCSPGRSSTCAYARTGASSTRSRPGTNTCSRARGTACSSARTCCASTCGRFIDHFIGGAIGLNRYAAGLCLSE
jgi:hypothetical protein